jgi:hypothetical protein
MEMSGYLLEPAALPSLKILRNPPNRRLGKFQRQSGKEKNLLSCRVSDKDYPVVEPVALHYRLRFLGSTRRNSDTRKISVLSKKISANMT